MRKSIASPSDDGFVFCSPVIISGSVYRVRGCVGKVRFFSLAFKKFPEGGEKKLPTLYYKYLPGHNRDKRDYFYNWLVGIMVERIVQDITCYPEDPYITEIE